MNFRSQICDLRLRRRAARRGFTFLEILFAVIVMGVGMIMVAGIFPVAIKQTRDNVEDTMGTIVAQDAIKLLQNVSFVDIDTSGNLTRDLLRPAAQAPLGQSVVYPFDPSPSAPDPLWNRVRGDVIVQNDPRYAWVGFFRREVATTPTTGGNLWAPTAQVFVIAVRVRNKDVYAYPNDTQGYLAPKLMKISVLWDQNLYPSGAIQFTSGPIDAVGDGAFVILKSGSVGQTIKNGRIYKLGSQVPGTSDTWYLVPPYHVNVGSIADFNSTESVSGPAYVVGRGPDAAGYSGPVQDIGIATGFISVPLGK